MSSTSDRGLIRVQNTPDEGPEAFSRVSVVLLDAISGEHDLSDMDKDQKLTFLYGIKEAFNAIERVGWIEHTNDWDIEFGFRVKGGEGHGTLKEWPKDSEDFDQVYDFEFPNGIKYDRHETFPLLAGQQTETHIQIVGMKYREKSEDEGDFSLQIPINQITHFYVGG